MSFHLVSLIDFLALIQGVLLGAILIIGNRKKRPTILLGFFLITYSIELLPAILNDTGLDQTRPYLLFLPIKFLFLAPPLLYLYAKSLTQTISFKKNLLLFIPAGIEFFVFLLLFLLAPSVKESLHQNEQFSLYYELYFYCGLLFAIGFCYLTIQLVNKHQEKVLNYFSNTEKRQLSWVKAIAFFLIIFGLLWFIPLFFIHDETSNAFAYLFLSTINVIFIFWVGISGLQQPKVNMLSEISGEESLIQPQKILEKTVNSTKDEQSFQDLIQLVEQKQVFKEPELTLPALAKELHLTRRSLSQLINQKSGVNFNQFINQYRVLEAKKMLVDPAFDHLNMLGIAFEVGFSSKATFFSVFKKLEGMSPGVFKKQRLGQ